jgi:hypothetical protein
MTRPSNELAAEPDKRTSYHFYPCAFSKVVAWFHGGVDERNLPKHGDFFNWNGFWFHGADDPNNTRRLQYSKTRV